MRINKHDTQGTKPLLGKGELGYDDYVAGGDVGRVYIGTGTENIALAEKLEANMMTKAQFNALAEERKANRAGSGFDEWGKHRSEHPNIDEGMWLSSTLTANAMFMGRISTDGGIGVSKSDNPIINSNGTLLKIINVANSSTFNTILLPTAPNIYPHDTVLTTEQIASGVIKHADSSNSGLIVNGKFDTNTSRWSGGSGATLSTESGSLKVQGGVTNYPFAYQVIPTVIGKKYKIEGYSTSGVNTAFSAYSANPLSGGTQLGIILNTIPTNRYSTVEFTATTTSTWIICSIESTVDNSSATFDNIAVYPLDAISRSDLVFLENWHEDVSEKNFVYPLGNVQYLGANTDGLTGITNGTFTGFETYSLFGNWQTSSSLIGKGYVWSNLTEAQKRAFIANPENNCYLDGDKVIQVRYRVRVVQGLGDSWDNLAVDITSILTTKMLRYNSNSYVLAKGKLTSSNDFGVTSATNPRYVGKTTFFDRSTDYGAFFSSYEYFGDVSDNPVAIAYEGKCFALPIAIVHRRNQGMYHNVYNPNGTKLASDGLDCFRTTVSFTSISDCFDPAKLLAASGYIGSVSGRPDGLFYDQVHERDITDLRNSSKKVKDYNRLINREFNKLVAGTTRGKEKEPFTESKLQTTTGTVATVEVNDGTAYESGSVVQIFDLTAGIVKGRFTVKSVSGNTLTVDSSFAKLANIYVIGGGKR